MTADELCNLIREDKKISIKDVDVVTTATKGLMSGTIAILSFRVSEAAIFKKAKELYLNDVPCYVGPCPNEWLGLIDTIIYGTTHSISAPMKYGAGHLFRDLVENKDIEVKVKTIEGKSIETTIRLQDIPFAKMFGIRNAFKNYLAFVNPHPEELLTIFSTLPFKGNWQEATFCGCGEINPIQKDPDLNTIGIGSPILMNGGMGYIMGNGTRSSKEKPNLMAIAEMHEMRPEYLGGFITASGPEPIITWAIAIPVLNEKIFHNLMKTDEKTELVVTDVKGRFPLEKLTYADVWRDVDIQITYDKEKCVHCEACKIEKNCPVNGFSHEKNIDQSVCFNCGICVNLCEGKAFRGKLGTIRVQNREIPITVRQSDKCGALKLASELKEQILSGKFKLNLPVAKINF